MNEESRYEDEFLKRLDGLPLPNEDMAWDDMKRRLEADDEDKPVIVPLLKGCGGYALLGLVLVIAFLLVVDPAGWFHRTTESGSIKTEKNKDKISTEKLVPVNNENSEIVSKPGTANPGKIVIHPVSGEDTAIQIKEVLEKRSSVNGGSNKQKVLMESHKQPVKKRDPFRRRKNNKIEKNHPSVPLIKKINGKLKSAVSGNVEADSVNNQPKAGKENKQPLPVKTNDSVVILTPSGQPGFDTAKKKLDTVAVKEKSKPDTSNKKRVYFSAGLGIHQLLPVAGQKSNPYNSSGRKSSLGDYIPSLYLRMYKDKKWFIQSEFRYGAPQYTKEILFSQVKIADTLSSLNTTTNSRVKKTFYHQLPISFNYFVLPGLSIGAGITFNKFSSALIQQAVIETNTTTLTDSLVSSGLGSRKKADSNFVSTYFQALVELQYQRGRFAAGARYSFGLQPYLKFNLPGGEQRKESNTSLQLFIRYEFWRSGKK